MTSNQELINRLEAAKTSNLLSQASFDNICTWLKNIQLSDFHSSIAELGDAENWPALNDAFFKQIEFGTGGIRGKTGLGSTRINRQTVGLACQGLADYITQQGSEAMAKGVVVGGDTRLTTPEFIKLTANILTSNNIKVYQFENPRQVGMFSYAVRQKKAIAGVYISASHNPPTDNGLKIYWEDGAQVLPPHDKAITKAVLQTSTIQSENPRPELIENIGEDFDADYRNRVLKESIYPSRSAKIVYSPFHGTGIYGVLPTLRQAGYEVVTVDEQMEPDGNFPNVPGGIPNPQNSQSNRLTAEKVLAVGADLGISTDPDADRLGLVIPKDGEAVLLSGNQTVGLLAYFIAKKLKSDLLLPPRGFFARTVVTSGLIDAIAEDFGLKCYNDLPVGFKYIGQIIARAQDEGDEQFIFGGEESFGCLKGDYARDKDASSASLMAAEMISWLKDEGRTVWDLMAEIEARYGRYSDDAIDVYYEGATGFETMAKLMADLRANPPVAIGPYPVISVIDRQSGEIKKPSGELISQTEAEKTDLLIFNLDEEGKSRVMIRPSGTEPKIKLYLTAFGDLDMAKLKQAANGLVV